MIKVNNVINKILRYIFNYKQLNFTGTTRGARAFFIENNVPLDANITHNHLHYAAFWFQRCKVQPDVKNKTKDATYTRLSDL